jgi:hypothetical protein
MNSSTFSYRIAFNLFESIGLDLIPKPGTISLDNNGILTLYDTVNQRVVLQKPFSELKKVSSSQLFHSGMLAGGANTAVLYVALNQAYKITFVSANPVLNSGLEMYENLLNGNMQSAKEVFKAHNITQADPAELKVALHQSYDDFANFIAAAKQAGVYRSALVSTILIAVFLLCGGVIAFLAYGYVSARH